MWPRFSLWSDYRAPARKYRMSSIAHGGRSSISRKIFLAAIIVVAAAIGIRELYGQAADTRVSDAPGPHSQTSSPPSVNATGRRFARAAAIPLSPQPVGGTDQVAALSPSPAPAPEADSAAGPKVSSDHPTPALTTPALAVVPGALAKASAPPPAALAAMKAADQPKSAVGRKVVRTVQHPHSNRESFGGYAEAIARLGHSKDLRAALRFFL
jgi:hypothetical protein